MKLAKHLHVSQTSWRSFLDMILIEQTKAFPPPNHRFYIYDIKTSFIWPTKIANAYTWKNKTHDTKPACLRFPLKLLLRKISMAQALDSHHNTGIQADQKQHNSEIYRQSTLLDGLIQFPWTMISKYMLDFTTLWVPLSALGEWKREAFHPRMLYLSSAVALFDTFCYDLRKDKTVGEKLWL